MSEVATESLAIMPFGDDVLYEVVDGQVVEKPRMSAYEGWVASILLRFMLTWPGATRHGRVVSEVLFRIDPTRNLERRPDVAFVSYERWPRRTPVPGDEAWNVVPDLAVEVISPTNGGNEIIRKVKDYFGADVKQVWVIYPLDQLIYIYTSPTTVQILQAGDELEGGTLLPGFRMAVSSLFEDDLADA